MATVTSVITNAINQANRYSNDAASMAKSAATAGMSTSSLGEQQYLRKPDIRIENFAPDDKQGNEFRIEYANRLNLDIEKFNDQFNTLMNTYYLNTDIDGNSIKQRIDKDLAGYLEKVIQTGKMLPEDAEQQIWDRTRDRDNLELERLTDSLLQSFASRGFSMAPGALSAKIALAEIEASRKASERNREISIENYRLAIENQKFAVDKLMQLRREMERFILDYIDLYFVKIPAKNADLERTIADLNRSAWQAVAQYYQLLIQVEGFKLDVDKYNSNLKFQAQQFQVGANQADFNRRVQSAISAAQTLASVAASYAGAQNSVTSLNESTIINK